jgi:sulfur-carrier protein
MIKILYFAGLREATGVGAEELAMPEGVRTVGALQKFLCSRGNSWAEALAETRRVRAAVNQDMAAGDTSVRDGDEVAFFPPVTGG